MSSIVKWEIWFIEPKRRPGAIATVDLQLRTNISRLTTVTARSVPLDQVEPAMLDKHGDDTAIALVSHLEDMSETDVDRLAGMSAALRTRAERQGRASLPVHLCFIHRDPTASEPSAFVYRDILERLQHRLDRFVCIGPRMHSRLSSQWPAWTRRGVLVELTAGMVGRPQNTPEGPMLRPLPEKSSVRVLFGSPTSPSEIPKRGLDVFAKAAGLVQHHFLDRRVDLTFVVSAVRGEIYKQTVTEAGRDPVHTLETIDADERLLEQFERKLTEFALETFDGGLTEFEVRPLTGQSDWFEMELNRADVFVLPSRDEPFGLVAAEALSRGTPVVVSHNSGFGEGLLRFASETFLPVDRYVCALTPSGIADAIQAVIENDRSRQFFRLVADGAYERFSWANAAHQLLEALEVDARFFTQTVVVTETSRRMVARELEGTGDAPQPQPQPALAVLNSAGVLPAGQGDHAFVFNVPILKPWVEQIYTSNLGRTVTVETNGATRFVRKVLDPDHQVEPGLARQWSFVNERLPESPYPELLHATRAVSLMEYFEQRSLDHIEDVHRATELLSLALDTFMSSVVTVGLVASGPSPWDFCQRHLAQRSDRLRAAVARLEGSNRERLTFDPDELVDRCGAVFDRLRQRVDDEPVQIGLAIHGDLGINNIVVAADRLGSDRIAFIDTRAEWVHDVPVWDVALDLASLYVFASKVHWCLAKEFDIPPRSPLHGKDDLLVSAIERAVVKSGHEATDPAWRTRVEAGCIVRLLGSVSINLAAPERHIERANRIAELTGEMLELPELLWSMT